MTKELHSIDITKYPITTNTFTWSLTASFLSIVLHILSLFLPSVMIMTFFSFAMDSFYFHWRVFIIFVDLFAWWGIYILVSLLLGKMTLIILNMLHKPKEGLFRADHKNKDYKFYCLRYSVKKFIFWIWNNFCFPWAANLAFKLCDMRADYKSTLFDGWSDLEFIYYGNNMMIGQGAVVLSSMIIRIDKTDYLLIKKVIIGDHVVLGGHSIVAPGTIIGKGTTLGIWAVTHIGQKLDSNWIYIGKPARKYQPTDKAREENKKLLIRRIVDTNERIPFDMKSFKKKSE
ncbi:MAG: hypothetical protein P8Y23_05590 [Candidatus Lokiarchaeota archaeon]